MMHFISINENKNSLYIVRLRGLLTSKFRGRVAIVVSTLVDIYDYFKHFTSYKE